MADVQRYETCAISYNNTALKNAIQKADTGPLVHYSDYAALEAENKRLREEVKYCKSCFKANPCGNAIKEQDRDELLRRYREALEKIATKYTWRDRGHICQSKQELESATMVAKRALEAQDADK